MNADSSSIQKRPQVQNALTTKLSAELLGAVINGPAVGNDHQAWHPLQVLDTIEMF